MENRQPEAFYPNFFQGQLFHKVLKDKDRIVVARTHRRVGKTCGLAHTAFQVGLLKSNQEILVVSPDRQISKNFLDEFRSILAQRPHIPVERDTQDCIEFGDGSRLRTVSNRLGFCGCDADLILVEEAAYVEHTVWDQLIPMMLKGSVYRPAPQVVMASTPSYDPDSYFKEICKTDKWRDRSTQIFLPITKNPDWAKEDIEVAKKYSSLEQEWKVEWLAMFPN